MIPKTANKIQISNFRKKLLSGGMWALTGQVSLASTGLAISALLARLLSPNEMGAYLLIVSGISILALIGQLGFNQTVVKYIGESIGTNQQSAARSAITIVFAYSVPFTLVLSAIIALGGWEWASERVLHSIHSDIGLLVGLWVVLVTVQKLLAETFRGFQDIKLAVLFSEASSKIVTSILLVCLWSSFNRASLLQVIVLFIVPLALIVFLAVLTLAKKLRSLPYGQSKLNARKLLADAWPFLITNLSLFLLLQVDIWILGIFLPEGDVAIYGVTGRLVILVTMPLLVTNLVVPPFIAELYAQKRKAELEALLRDITTLAAIPALIGLIGFAVFGRTILHYFFGEFYVQGAPILIVLSLSRVINVMAGSCGNLLMMTGYQKAMMAVSLISGFLTIAGGFVFVPVYGVLGMASVATTTLILQNVAMLFLAKKYTGVWTHAYLTHNQIGKMIRKYNI